MTQKIYGAKSIGNLREQGYSARALEDITQISEGCGIRPSNVTQYLSKGYNSKQISEIYGASKENKLPVKDVKAFYDAFKPLKGELSQKIMDVETFQASYEVYEGYNTGHEKLMALRGVTSLGKDYGGNFEETMMAFENKVNRKEEPIREFYQKESDFFNAAEYSQLPSFDPNTGNRIW